MNCADEHPSVGGWDEPLSASLPRLQLGRMEDTLCPCHLCRECDRSCSTPGSLLCSHGWICLFGTTNLPWVKPQSQHSLLFQGKMPAGVDFHQMLLTWKEGQSPGSDTNSQDRKENPQEQSELHTQTHSRGAGEGRNHNQQEKKNISSNLHPQHSTGLGLGVQADPCLGPVGSPEPNRDEEISQGTPRQKENVEPLRWKT